MTTEFQPEQDAKFFQTKYGQGIQNQSDRKPQVLHLKENYFVLFCDSMHWNKLGKISPFSPSHDLVQYEEMFS